MISHQQLEMMMMMMTMMKLELKLKSHRKIIVQESTVWISPGTSWNHLHKFTPGRTTNELLISSNCGAKQEMDCPLRS